VGIWSTERIKKAGRATSHCTLFWRVGNPTKNLAKNVQSRRLNMGRIGREVREQMENWGIGGERGNLLQVEWSLRAFRNQFVF
jgi:hypothetical protein